MLDGMWHVRDSPAAMLLTSSLSTAVLCKTHISVSYLCHAGTKNKRTHTQKKTKKSQLVREGAMPEVL